MAGVDDEVADPHFAHLAEGNARQARKRVAADALIRDPTGRVLMVDPTYKEGWDLPGGMVEDNESPSDGVRREVAEELHLTVAPGRPLVVEWVDAHGPWDDQMVFVFDGGTLTADDIAGIAITDDEIAEWRFVEPSEPGVLLRPHIRERLLAACDALKAGDTAYYERRPPDEERSNGFGTGL